MNWEVYNFKTGRAIMRFRTEAEAYAWIAACKVKPRYKDRFWRVRGFARGL